MKRINLLFVLFFTSLVAFGKTEVIAPVIEQIKILEKTSDWDPTLDILVSSEEEIKDDFSQGVPSKVKIVVAVSNFSKSKKYKLRLTIIPYRDAKKVTETYKSVSQINTELKEVELSDVAINPQSLYYSKYVFLVEVLSSNDDVLVSKERVVKNPSHSDVPQ